MLGGRLEKMRKLSVVVAAALVGLSGAAFAQVQLGGGQGTPSENANCLAQERAQRNSRGRDREKGGFGQAQAQAARAPGAYGQALKAYKEAGCPGAPGPVND
jgi:hypothetical protein